MMPPLLLDGFSSPVAFCATTAGIYTAARVLPTLDEVRTRRRGQRRPCTCSDGSCDRCFLDEDAAFEAAQDV